VAISDSPWPLTKNDHKNNFDIDLMIILRLTYNKSKIKLTRKEDK
jgi:hypothetical protein